MSPEACCTVASEPAGCQTDIRLLHEAMLGFWKPVATHGHDEVSDMPEEYPSPWYTYSVFQPQTVDSVTQANVEVLGDAPALATSNLYVATSQALANAAHNATSAQQQMNFIGQAATNQGVAALYSVDTAATGKATQMLLGY